VGHLFDGRSNGVAIAHVDDDASSWASVRLEVGYDDRPPIQSECLRARAADP
jgi:hypothetical protein